MATTRTSDLTRAAQLFHALSDETRLRILETIRDREQCVCDLTDALDAAQSRLSFHLKVLKDAGLVTDRKEGRWSFYEIDPAGLEELGDLVAAIQPGLGQPRLTQIVRGNERSVTAARKKAVRNLAGGCCR